MQDRYQSHQPYSWATQRRYFVAISAGIPPHDRTLSEYINVDDVEFTRELEQEEEEAGSSSSSSLQLSGSELATVLAKEKKEEEVGFEKVPEGSNLAEAKPILVLSSNDDAPEVIVVP